MIPGIKFSARQLFIALILAGPLLFSLGDRAQAEDFGYWNEFVLKHKIDENLSVHFKSEEWFLGDVSRLGLYNFTSGLTFHESKYFDLEFNYRYQKLKLFTAWTEENRFEIIPHLKADLFGFQFALRNRLEFRSIDGNDSLRLRERITIKKDFKLNQMAFDVYISNEFFYDTNVDDYNQNRAKAGIIKEIFPGVKMGLYYMYWTLQAKTLYEANVIGTTFTISF
ncbi:MAG: DUF2490 domain-containing protein [Candidatus Nitronauta litoralis]|uniref:DUF2490 domain-containing protein n=1 Tax=Candidatus Nitronauta litoralis TaxID=2705533 RepID=A0A7T0BTT0_9BACT|nr:MAG: DUF2490 domain-containing protein [Candidatus Nitronauta litoralis]